MMEYVILSFGFFVTLAASGYFFWPGDSDYGGLGNSFIRHYNMVLDLISMPYP